MKIKRLVYYLLINIFVSACVTLLVLQIWAARQPDNGGTDPLSAVMTGVAGNSQGITPLPDGSRPRIVTVVVTAPPPEFTPYPTRGIVTYRVKEGDTLGGIAIYFGVSLEDLMALNELSDPNRVVSGVEILIPPPPTETPIPTDAPTDQPTATPTPRPSATSGFTPTPTGPTPTPGLLIQSVQGAGDLNTERIIFQVNGTGEVNLTGWRIVAENGDAFLFPQLILRSGGQVSVYTRAGEPSVTLLYWGLPQALWQSGDVVQVLDADGTERSRFEIP